MSNVRVKHEKILELIENGLYTNKQVLEELLVWLPSFTIDNFFETAFGNEGFIDQ